jgi:hypothetical protein
MTSRPCQINGKGGSQDTHILPYFQLWLGARMELLAALQHRRTLAFTSSAAYDGSRLLLQRPSCNASRMTLGRGLCGLRRLGVA